MDPTTQFKRFNELIQQRFSELEEKASAVEKTSYSSGRYVVPLVNSGKFKEWATNVLALLQRVFGENSPHYNNFLEQYNIHKGAITMPAFEDCRGVFRAAKEDYEAGYLFSIRGLIKAEDSMDALEQANELLRAGYKDPACAVAGVALEITLKELCTRNSIALAKLDVMNIELCKKGIYNMGVQKLVTAWAHWRNKAAHGEWDQYSNVDVQEMINGITRFVAEYL